MLFMTPRCVILLSLFTWKRGALRTNELILFAVRSPEQIKNTFIYKHKSLLSH